MLIDEEGFVKLADFGVARILNGLYADDKVATTICGSPYYVAPEVVGMSPYGRECDYWSIGVVVYALLCGKMPFFAKADDIKENLSIEGLNSCLLFKAIRKCEYSFHGKAWKSISPEAKDFIK